MPIAKRCPPPPPQKSQMCVVFLSLTTTATFTYFFILFLLHDANYSGADVVVYLKVKHSFQMDKMLKN